MEDHQSLRISIYNRATVERVWAERRRIRQENSRPAPEASPQSTIKREKDWIAPRSKTLCRRADIDPDRLRPTVPFPGTMRDIASQVAFWHGYMLRDLTGDSRLAPVVRARIDAVQAIKAKFGSRKSSNEIAQVFNLEHSTVLHHCRDMS